MLDILIIGSGGAGLSSALCALEQGSKVLVVGKSYPTASQTSMAQGGMNASLGNVMPDSIEAHIGTRGRVIVIDLKHYYYHPTPLPFKCIVKQVTYYKVLLDEDGYP